jgi:hypothetical protein
MKRSKATSHLPLFPESPGSHHGIHQPWPALLALTLVATAASGCPGGLDQTRFLFIDAGSPMAVGPLSGPGPQVVKMDAAAVAPPPAAVANVPPPSAAPRPPARAIPPAIDKTTCAQPAEIASKIFTPKCGGCHAGTAPPAGLDLVSAGLKARLVNVPSKSPSSGCAGQVLATAAGSAGVILNKLLGVGCGAQMPAMSVTLSNQEYWCIQEWLNPGAGGPFPPVAGYLEVAKPAAPATPPPAMPPPEMPPPATAPPVGGAGKLDGGAAPPPPAPSNCSSPQEISDKILKPKCLPCHAAKLPSLGLDLESAGAKARVLGVSAKGCASQTLAKPDGTGLLFDLITNMVPPGCGQPMPFGGLPPLSAEEVACMRDWIRM